MNEVGKALENEMIDFLFPNFGCAIFPQKTLSIVTYQNNQLIFTITLSSEMEVIGVMCKFDLRRTGIRIVKS